MSTRAILPFILMMGLSFSASAQDRANDAADATLKDEFDAPPRFGEALPLSRRSPMLKALEFGVNVRYGLVGTGPTRFVNDLRFGITDWLEVRSSLTPYPSSLMLRASLFEKQKGLGTFIIDGGLANFDAGLRLVTDEGEPQVGLRAHLETGIAHDISLGKRFSLFTSARYRIRVSGLDNDDQQAFSVDTQLTYDLTRTLSVSGGLGAAFALTPVREIAINFVETSRPGMNHILLRDDEQTSSVTIPLAITYGRTESFDVDVFCTPRVFPEVGVVFGAGLRWRFGFAKNEGVSVDEVAPSPSANAS